ncbi:hypothetical protein MBLNU457_3594t1 [Dothideomycetes sp. NU457]
MSSPMALPSSPELVKAKLLYDFDVLIGVTAALLAVSTVSVGLRSYVRGYITKTFGWDDATMVAAWFCYFVVAALTFIATKSEYLVVDTGVLNMALNSLVQLIRYTNIVYSLTMIIVKISIGIFFLKLFSTTSFNWQRWTIIGMMGLTTILGTAYLIMTFATCAIMVQSQKTTALHTGTDWCPIQDTFVRVSITYSVVNIITDFVWTGLAIVALVRAKMSTSTKVSASCLLSFGAIGCIASIMRVVAQAPVTDIRLAGVVLAQWSNIEAGMCIIAGSLMTLRPLVQPVIEKARSTFSAMSSKASRAGSDASSQELSGNVSSVKSFRSQESDIEKGEMGVTITKTFTVTEKAVLDSETWSNKS